MKTLLVVFAAAGIGALSVYVTLELTDTIALTGSGSVIVRVDVFVALLVVLGLLAAGLALLFRSLMGKADEKLLSELEARLTRVEGERRQGV